MQVFCPFLIFILSLYNSNTAWADLVHWNPQPSLDNLFLAPILWEFFFSFFKNMKSTIEDWIRDCLLSLPELSWWVLESQSGVLHPFPLGSNIKCSAYIHSCVKMCFWCGMVSLSSHELTKEPDRYTHLILISPPTPAPLEYQEVI